MPSPRKINFEELISGIARELKSRQLDFMLIGGQAVLLHGRPRTTEDIDVTVAADPSRLHHVSDVAAELGLTPLADDLQDAASVVRRKESEIDWIYVTDWIHRFGKIEGHEQLEARLKELRHPRL